MATLTPNTPSNAGEAARHPDTPVGLCFVELLHAVAWHLFAQDRLVRSGDDHMRSDDLHTEVDETRATMLAVLARITGMTAGSDTDMPLLRMALLLATLVREDRAEAFRRYFEREEAFAEYLHVPGNDRQAARVRHMIEAGHKRIRFMARLAQAREKARASREIADAVAHLEPALAA